MISPLECGWYVKLLLGMLATLGIFVVMNFIFVLTGNNENELYKRFDKATELFSRGFGIVLLATILWALCYVVVRTLG